MRPRDVIDPPQPAGAGLPAGLKDASIGCYGRTSCDHHAAEVSKSY
jgi:hypothetical protein